MAVHERVCAFLSASLAAQASYPAGYLDQLVRDEATVKVRPLIVSVPLLGMMMIDPLAVEMVRL